MKKMGNFIGTLLIIMGVMVTMCFPLLMFVQPLKYTETSQSPGGNYTVVVKHSDGQWSFGPARVKVIGKDGLLKRATYLTEIADDGGRGNITIVWLSDTVAQVTLWGSEQKDEIILIEFGDGIEITSVRDTAISTSPISTPSPTPILEETQTPMPSEDPNLREYFLNVGDGKHSFLVEVKFSEKPRMDFPESDMGLTLSFYAKETDPQPVQVIETGTMMWNDRFELVARDVDFDGDMDFYYSYHEGAHGNTSRSFYIWDEELECFVDDPYGLGKMRSAGIDEENQAVVDYEGGINYERITYYRYNYATMELYPCRALYYGGWREISNMHVSDYIDGEWVTVFDIESEDVFSGPDYEEFCRWKDLDYHGE